MFCKKCGNQNPDDVKFCKKCGEKLTTPTNPVQQPNVQKQNIQNQPIQPLSTSGKGMAIGALICGIIATVLGAFVSIIGIIFGIAGLILGIMGKKKMKMVGIPTSMATVGLILSIIGLSFGLIMVIVSIFFVNAIDFGYGW